ncbi:hypothetical protein C8R43DRAFT_899832 [Mycena crocata]|nr:hypothetical protein C8R43DRAFT_899832 [Mycena crocata]
MTEAFAGATGQEFVIYYASDTVGRGKKKTILRGQNAEDAWNTPIKSHALDLSGRLALVIGMPVFIVNNIAVELGLANGSGGILINLEYEVREGRRYGISAEVDLPLYTSPDPEAEFPHRIVLPLDTKPIKFSRQEERRLKNLASRTMARAKEDLDWYLNITGDIFE